MKPVISIIMGSKSDWATMQKTAEILDRFGVAYEKKVVSAHRTPDLMFKHAEEARSRGIKVIIAEDPKSCVAIGTGKSLDILDKLESNALNRRAPYL